MVTTCLVNKNGIYKKSQASLIVATDLTRTTNLRLLKVMDVAMHDTDMEAHRTTQHTASNLLLTYERIDKTDCQLTKQY